MFYLKRFDTHEEYSEYLASNDEVAPYVNVCGRYDDVNPTHLHYYSDDKKGAIIMKLKSIRTAYDVEKTHFLFVFADCSGGPLPSDAPFDKVVVNGRETTYTDIINGNCSFVTLYYNDGWCGYDFLADGCSQAEVFFYLKNGVEDLSNYNQVFYFVGEDASDSPNLSEITYIHFPSQLKNLGMTFDYSNSSGQGDCEIAYKPFCPYVIDVDNLESWLNLSYSTMYDCWCQNVGGRITYYDEETGDSELKFDLSINNKIGDLHIDVPLGLTDNQKETAFCCIDNLVSANIPSGYTQLTNFMFNYNKSLTSVTLNQIPSAIPTSFLSDTPNLRHFDIPNGVKRILGSAFQGCGLYEIHIPKSVSSITAGINSTTNAFGYMPSVTAITVDSGNTYYDSRDNCNAIIRKSNNSLIKGCINTVIPPSVSAINACAFARVEFEEYTVPDSISGALRSFVFAECKKLKKINTGKNITGISAYCFNFCTALEEVHIEDKTLAITSNTFYYCTNLIDVYFGSGITTIPTGSFDTCHPEIRLHFTSATPPNLPQTWAAEMPNITIVVPADYYSTYAQSTSFNRYVSQMIPEEGGEWITVHVTASTDSSSLSAALSSYSTQEITKLKVIGTINSYDVKLWRETLTSLFYLDLSEATIVACDYAYYSSYKTKNNDVTEEFVGPYVYDLKLPNNVTSMESACCRNASRLHYCNIPSGITYIPERCFQSDSTFIEAYIDGNITEIGQNAFYSCKNLKRIDIPSTCTSIGRYAFYDCSALTSVNISDNVTYIGEACFSRCQSLNGITIPSHLQTLGNQAFCECYKLSGEIIIPNTLTSFQNSAFTDCRSIESVKISNGITKIPDSTFKNCSGMTSLTIPNSVTSIEDEAFYNCQNITSNINLPTRLTEIGASAFTNCYKITGALNLGPNITTLGKWAFRGCYKLTGTITIPTGITAIQEFTFYRCYSLNWLVLHSGVTTIGTQAFYNCSGLTGTLSIPSALTSIADNSFALCSNFDHIVVDTGNTVYDSRNNCDALIETSTDKIILCCKNTTIPNTVTELGDNAFANQTGLTSIVIPDSIEKMGVNVFNGCYNLSSVTIGTGLTEIGTSTFANCSALTSVVIPSNIKTIGINAFYYCKSLSSVTFSEGLETIERYAFYETSLSSIALPNSIMYVGQYSFNDTPWYRSLPSYELTYLGNVAYIYKMNLQSQSAITLSAGTTCIAGGCFRGQSNLTGITIPNTVRSIGEEAFYSCTKLAGTLSIPENMERIGNSAFFRCSALTMVDYASVECLCRIQYDGQSANPRAEKSALRPIYVQGVEQTSITVPNTVDRIGNYALYYATGITSVTLHSGVKKIGDWALYYCSGLTSVNITDGVEYIGNFAFASCNHLTSINIPDSVNILGQYAFTYCSAATQAYIGSGITEYGVNSQSGGDNFCNPFSNCSGLTSLTINTDIIATSGYPSSSRSVIANLFNKNIKSLTIGNAVTSISEYFCPSSSGLTNISIGNGVKDIGIYAFSGCSAVTSITLGSSVQTIGDNAFNGCNSYTALTLPNSLQTIGASAFSFNKIVTITIPNSVTSLGNYAFYSGASATSITVGDGTTSIGNMAFRYSTKVTTATIGSAVTSLGNYAFGNCTSLMSLTVKPTSPPTWHTNPLYYVPSTCKIYVPSASVTAYKNATGWKDRKNYIQAIP